MKAIFGCMVWMFTVLSLAVAAESSKPLPPNLDGDGITGDAWMATHQIPAPFSEISVQVIGDIRQFTLQNKVMDFDNNGLLSRIQVSGSNLLAAPIAVYEVRNHVRKQLGFSQSNVVRAETGASVSFSSSAVLEQGSPEAGTRTLRVEGTLEYDGLLRYRLSVDEVPAWLEGSRIVIELPLAESLVRFVHRPAAVGQRNLALASAEGTRYEFEYFPFYWFGNDDAGIYWFAESTAGWANADPSKFKPITLEKKAGQWVLSIDVLMASQTHGDWQHEFGFLPTPVKALPENWRQWRLFPFIRKSHYVMWPDSNDADMKHFGFPLPNSWEKMRRQVGDMRRGRVTAAPYVTPFWVDTTLPEFAAHEQKWATRMEDSGFPSASFPRSRFVHVCPRSASWNRQFGDAVTRMIQDLRLSAIYLDNAQTYSVNGCIAPENSGSDSESPLLAQRRTYQIIANALQSNGNPTQAIVHSSRGLNLMSFPVADAWVTGEEYRGIVMDDYLDVATLTDFRVELNGQKWGIVPLFLPQFDKTRAAQVAPTRGLLALTLLHDALVWPFWANLQVVEDVYDSIDEFMTEDAEFHPYYRDSTLFHTVNPDVYVSDYTLSNGFLAIVANLGASDTEATLCLREPASHSHVLVDAQEQVLTQGCLKVLVKSKDFRLIRND